MFGQCLDQSMCACIGIQYIVADYQIRIVSINIARYVISESCYLYSVDQDSIWSCLHRKCAYWGWGIVHFPQRINNKIIITKSTERLKGWFFFLQYSLFTRRKREDISYRGKVLYGKIIKKNKRENLNTCMLVLIVKAFSNPYSRNISKWDETLTIWASCHNIIYTIAHLMHTGPSWPNAFIQLCHLVAHL